MRRLGLFIILVATISVVALFTTTYRNAAAGSGNASAGRKVHISNCARCHGTQGRGDGPAAKLLKTKPADWTDKKKMSGLSDAYLYKIISGGGAAAGKSTLMPGYKGKLSDSQIHDVISFIRSL